MPRGTGRAKRLTAEERAIAAEVYIQTGSLSATARAVGVEPSSISYLVTYSKRVPTLQHSHGEAVQEAIRRARAALVGQLDPLLLDITTAPNQHDKAMAVKSYMTVVDGLLRMEARVSKGSTERLQRDLIRAQLAGKVPTGGQDGTVKSLLDYLTTGKVGPTDAPEEPGGPDGRP